MNVTNGMKRMKETNPTETKVDILETALRWYDQGFLPIPFLYGRKRALVKFSKYLNGTPRPPRSTISRWFGKKWKVSPEGINLALLCGVGGLVCLDFDKEHLFWMWNCWFPRPFTRVTRTPRGGFHVWFKVKDVSSLPRLVVGVEIKARGTVNDVPGHTKDGEYTHFYSPKMKLPIAEAHTIDSVLRAGLYYHDDDDNDDGCQGGDCPGGYSDCNQRGEGVDGGFACGSQVQEGVSRGKGVAANGCRDITTTSTTTFPSPTPASSLAVSANPPQRLSPVAAIKSYGGLERLVAQYTTLDPSGPHHLSGCCPFHDDATPSFWVDTSTQLCGCRVNTCRDKQHRGRPMDIISFYSRVENISARDSIRLLHRRMI